MKIKSLRAFPIDLSKAVKSNNPSFVRQGREPAGPMARYPIGNGQRSAVSPPWKRVACVAEAEDGTFGLGLTAYSGAVVPIINDHFSPHLTGQSVMATEKHFDMMVRMSALYGSSGLPSYAISAVDLALWDLKGKLLGTPVYELLGGPQKERIFCYATGFDVEWYLELGFKAVKLPMPYGPVDGLEGLLEAEKLIAEARRSAGDSVSLMLDCWMALDVEYTVAMVDRFEQYRLKWIEDYLLPDDFAGYAEIRRRLPRQGLATGEHWYLPPPFATAISERLVDFLQPDVRWVGGITATTQICHIAASAGIQVLPHGGMNDPYGQHVVYAMPAASWGEKAGGLPPGIAPEQMAELPGSAVVKDGYLVPSDAPGFGIDVDREWLDRAAV
jgi:L-rhamnonate dehydratase